MDPQTDPFDGEQRPAWSSLETVHPMGDILEELFAQFQRRFPELRLAVVETPAAVP